jgi:hypothetical protein
MRGSSFYSGHVFVPDHGFIIFGGITAPGLIYSQQLYNLTTAWTFGPALYEDKTDNRASCYQTFIQKYLFFDILI